MPGQQYKYIKLVRKKDSQIQTYWSVQWGECLRVEGEAEGPGDGRVVLSSESNYGNRLTSKYLICI